MINLTDEQYDELMEGLKEDGDVSIYCVGRFIVNRGENVPYYNVYTGEYESGPRVHISFTPSKYLKRQL